MSRVLAPVRDKNHVPGLIGAIVNGDRLAAIGAVGIRKIGSSQAMRVTDKVHLASCTVPMTATMIGTVIDAGKLSANTTIRQVFPRAAPQIHPDFQSVTLWRLLTHRAGLPGDGPWKELKPTLRDIAPAYGPAGTVHCTLTDWAKFDALHL